MQVVKPACFNVLRRRRSLSLSARMRIGLFACLLLALWSMARHIHPTQGQSKRSRKSRYPGLWLDVVASNEAGTKLEDVRSSALEAINTEAFCWRRDPGPWLRWLLQVPLAKGCAPNQVCPSWPISESCKQMESRWLSWCKPAFRG